MSDQLFHYLWMEKEDQTHNSFFLWMKAYDWAITKRFPFSTKISEDLQEVKIDISS